MGPFHFGTLLRHDKVCKERTPNMLDTFFSISFCSACIQTWGHQFISSLLLVLPLLHPFQIIDLARQPSDRLRYLAFL